MFIRPFESKHFKQTFTHLYPYYINANKHRILSVFSFAFHANTLDYNWLIRFENVLLYSNFHLNNSALENAAAEES